MGKCVICGLENQKAMLFLPSNVWYFMCVPHFVEYRNQEIRNINEWIKQKKGALK